MAIGVPEFNEDGGFEFPQLGTWTAQLVFHIVQNNMRFATCTRNQGTPPHPADVRAEASSVLKKRSERRPIRHGANDDGTTAEET